MGRKEIVRRKVKSERKTDGTPTRLRTEDKRGA
jgi:hypothetical protein